MPDKTTSRRGAIVITGASTGIGRAAALKLDRIGFRVFAGVRKEADARALQQEASDRLTPIMVDVTDEASIGAAVETVSAALGDERLAGLVNNAGIVVPGPLEFLPPDDLRRQLEVNVIGQVAVTQAFLPLIRRRRGRIVNVGSAGGRFVTPFLGAYHASKFAMEAISDAMRMELMPWRIHVSLIEPGNIATPFWDRGRSEADGVEGKLSDDARPLYESATRAMRQASQKFERRAIPPERVADAIAHALTAPRPKTRYTVGLDAKAVSGFVRFLPDPVRDFLITQQLGLPKRA